MGYFDLICIVAALTGSCHVAAGKKPHMYAGGESGELHLQVADELRIACYADGARLWFSFPEKTFLVPRTEPNVLPLKNGTYVFLRRKVLHTDGGWYACAEEGIEINDDFRNLNHSDRDVTWIYVYVSFSDFFPQQPKFMNARGGALVKTLIAVTGSAIVVPCRPTSPTVDVHLFQNDNLVDLKKNTVRYDPKIGFIMNEVDFVEGQALLRCRIYPYTMRNGFIRFSSIDDLTTDDYILRRADPKPTMFTAYNRDVILQEGDELRIECSNETKLSFLFPKLVSNTSAYEIVRNGNGTSTLLRRSVVSCDTGWYGCAALDIKDDFIPDYSIDDTRKEIAWVYVYVNSSVPIISGLVDATNSVEAFSTIIPCKPTSPESDIHLNRLVNNAWTSEKVARFDRTVGFLVFPTQHEVYQCATNEPIRFVSRNYSRPEFEEISSKYLQAVISEADDPSSTQHLVIKMTGDNLRMRCEKVAFDLELPNLDWTIPSTVTKKRVKYAWTPAANRVVDVLSFRKKALTMMIMNVTESDSGKYTCSAGPGILSREVISRDVEVFDKNGPGYIRLGKNGGAIKVAGQKQETVKWLVDLTDYPSARITWVNSQGNIISILGNFDGVRRRITTAWMKGVPLRLFVISGLTVADRGIYELRTNIDNTTAVVNVTVNVEEPLTISLTELGSEQIFSDRSEVKSNSSIGKCEAVGSLNVTVIFLKCPKFPSRENCDRLNFDDNSTIFHQSEDPTPSGRTIIKKFPMPSPMNHSGFVICQACNEFRCSEARMEYLHSVSEMPYFTFTNLNDSDVVLHLETHNYVLECFVSGTPRPSVTWFRDNVRIKEDDRHALRHDNSELRIQYFLRNESGQYKCRAENDNGQVEKYINVKIRGTPEPANIFSSSVIAAFVLLLLVIVICFVVIYRLLLKVFREKKFNSAFRKGAPDRFDPEQSVVDQAHLLPYHLKWEFPRELLKLGKILGSGAFGIVKKAEAKSICRGESVTTVAVKLVRSTASLNFIMALQRELKILAYLGKHPNVVNLLGACTRNVIYGELFVIVEYCRFGNLRYYLLNGRADFVDQIHAVSETASAWSFASDFGDESGLTLTVEGRNDVPAPGNFGQSEDNAESGGSSDDCTEDGDGDDAPRWASKYRADDTDVDSEPISTRDLVYWSWQVTRAMDFLGKRKIVHGDLAARNILLSDRGIVKVCDFGLAKALLEEAEYRDEGANPLPYRWMAIESIKDRVFSYQSDVWSFGVVMWEFFTLAETPYLGIRHRHLLQKLTDGYRLEQPKYAATSIYDIMRRCWEADPADRPSFVELAHDLADSLEDGFKTEYLEMHAQYTEINAEITEKERQDYLALSLEPPSANQMHEEIEMENLTRD